MAKAVLIEKNFDSRREHNWWFSPGFWSLLLTILRALTASYILYTQGGHQVLYALENLSTCNKGHWLVTCVMFVCSNVTFLALIEGRNRESGKYLSFPFDSSELRVSC